MNSEKRKELNTNLIRIIAFILAFFIILEGCSLIFFSPKSAANFANKLQDAYSFVDEPEGTIQIAGAGNSDLYSGFSPADLWHEFGYTSTICASARQSIQDSQYLMERLFETQSPKLVIIETDMLYDTNPDEKNFIEKTDKLSDLFDRVKPEFFERDVENVFSIFKFHNKWKKTKAHKSEFSTHGYRYNNKVVKLVSTDYMKETDRIEPVSKINQEQMNKLVSFCRSKGADVLFVVMPSVSSWNYERHNGVEDYAKSINVPFVDLNLHYNDMGISMKTCFRDKGNHLNYKGTKAVTKYLGSYIKQNYSIDKLSSNKNYDSWNKNYSAFVKKINNETI